MAKKKPRRRAGPMTPLRVTDSYKRFVLDQLDELGEVQARSMFGGLGLYHRDLFFGIVARDVLYLKVDDTTRGDYERAGMGPFRPFPGRTPSRRYYTVPLEVLESAEELARWARRAVAVAKKARPRAAR